MKVEGAGYGLTTLLDAAARQYSIKVTCGRCRDGSIFGGHALWHLFKRKSWSDRLTAVGRHLCCGDCWRRDHLKARPALLRLCRDKPTVADLRLPPEREWEAALSRYRR